MKDRVALAIEHLRQALLLLTGSAPEAIRATDEIHRRIQDEQSIPIAEEDDTHG